MLERALWTLALIGLYEEVDRAWRFQNPPRAVLNALYDAEDILLGERRGSISASVEIAAVEIGRRLKRRV